MATDAPTCIDVTEYQFKLHRKSTIFKATGQLRNNINLLASSSNYGLLFVGDPYKAEFRVLQHQNVTNVSDPAEKLLARNVQLPGISNNIAVSCDGLLLAVSYTQKNTDFLIIFSVPSFWTPNIEIKFNIRVHPEDNTNVTQILWNPVISNTFALILSNGAVGMYNLKNDNSYEFHSLDKNEQAKCACWSPKGKQIVIGFPSGKLTQYKPDLKPAKIIQCPPNIHEGPFDTIAVQWLSTYQFAVVFLQQGEDKQPSLYILNAPKNGNQTYINYYDICYSGSGPRQAQIFFNHIQSWNILLMASANSVEVGVLGTKEVGETPLWQQYITPDEARIELPLTSDKQETFPVGIAFDTGSTHQLTIGETTISVMPMIHVLSTHGMLISFNFLNLIPNAPGICSPPNPVSDSSGQFKPVDEIFGEENNKSMTSSSQPAIGAKVNQPAEVSFTISSGATSTPTADRGGNSIFGGSNSTLGSATISKPLFGSSNNTITANKSQLPTESSPFFLQPQQQQQQQQQSGSPFGRSNTLFGGTGSVGSTSFALNVSPQTTIKTQQNDGNQLTFGQPLAQSKPMSFEMQQKSDDIVKSKPLFTVPPTFTPSNQQMQQKTLQQSKQQQQQGLKSSSGGISKPTIQSDSDIDDIIKQMIATQINAFEKELHELSTITADLDISAEQIEETKSYTKRLNNLKELSEQAKDGGIEADVQTLRHSLNECFSMVAETKSKLNIYKNPHLTQLATMSNVNQTNRRQLGKLKQLITMNEYQLNIVNQLMDAQWSNHQDLVRQNSSKRKYMPNLEGIYQTLIRQKDILAQERAKLNYFKLRLGVKGLLDNTRKIEQNVDVNSLADSILSLSLSDQVLKDNSRLTNEKLKIIRETVKNRQIIKIKPQRPDRIGLNSEVILETRIKTMNQVGKEQNKNISAKTTQMKNVPVLSSNQVSITQQQQQQQQQQQPKKVDPKKQQQQTQPFIQMAATNPLKPSQSKTPLQQQQIVTGTVATVNTTVPTFPSVGSSFVKTNISQPAATNIFSGMPTGGAQTSIFAGSKKSSSSDQAKPLFGSLTITPIPSDTGLEKSKSSFTLGAEKTDSNNVKETTTAISFAPKIVDNDQSFGFGFVTIQDENKPTAATSETIKNLQSPKTTVTATASKQIAPIANQPSLFSSLNTAGFASITENKPLFSTTGFNSILSTKDANTNQTLVSTTVTQPTSVPTSETFSFGGLSMSAKPGTDIGTKSQELPPTPVSSSASSESLTSAASVTESFAFSHISKAPPSSAVSAPATFSFGSIQKPTIVTSVVATNTPLTANTNAAPSSNLLFGLNFASSSTATSVTTTTAAPSSAFSFASFGVLSTISSPTITTNTTTTAAPTSSSTETVRPTDLSVKSSNSTIEQTNILQGLNICKPTVSGNDTVTTSAPSNVLSENLLKENTSIATTVVKTTSSSPGLAFESATVTSVTPTFSAVAAPTTLDSGSIFGGTAVSATPSFFGSTSSTTTAPLFGTTTSTTTVASVCDSNTIVTSPASSATVFGTATAPTSVFGGTTSTTTPATSIFGGNSMPATSSTTLFGATTPETSSTTLFGAAIPATSSAFGSPIAATSSSGGLFGGVPKPTQAVFGVPGANSFSMNATTPLFGGQTTNQAVSSAGGIFGEASSTTSGFGMQMTTSTPSAFGTTAVSQSVSPFGGANTNLFASALQASPTSGGSLFGSSSFGNSGQTTGSIFGGSGAGVQSTGFGSAFAQPSSSPFGGTQTQQSSPFGGGGAANATSTFGQGSFGSPPSFGQASGGFGSTSPGGTFAQGGPSVAQTGFGSPGAFSKPAFGGSPTFGGAPTFGSSPTFGGGATFGSPKSAFGTFGATNTGAFSPPSQKNNLFESLGSSETGLSFGNLAQNTNPNAAPKTQFGGSSFSSWR